MIRGIRRAVRTRKSVPLIFANQLLGDFRKSASRRSYSYRFYRLLIDSVGTIVILAKWRVAGLSTRDVPFFQDRYSLLQTAASRAEGGLWLEFGVYRGDSLNRIAALTNHRVFGFDSFRGLPSNYSPKFPTGAFSTGGVLPRVRDNVTLVSGWFEDTLPDFLRQRRGFSVSFLHVDCDLYASAKFVLDCLAKGFSRGTVIVFDEFCTPMPDDEARAFREVVKSRGFAFTYLGCSINGSVAVEITSA